MKNISYIFILILFLLTFSECKTRGLNKKIDAKDYAKYISEINKVLIPKHFKNYEVTKIDSSLLNTKKGNDVYQIYAKKNDTIIKIISFKNRKKSNLKTKIKWYI